MSERPIRVLHLLNSVTDVGCGIVNAALDIISGQILQSLDVAVCSNPGGFVSLLKQNGIRHFPLDQGRRVVNLPRATIALRQIIKQFQPDIVHCHMMTGMVLARAVRITTRFGLVAHVHNVHQRSSNLMRLADRVVAVSNAVMSDMAARGVPRRKLRVVHNGTLGSLRLLDLATAEPKNLSQPAIVTVGGMNHRKGIAELISAFEQVSERIPGPHLYLVGNGPNRLEFETQAAASRFASNIHFEGFQANPFPYMKAAHTFVLASRRDSFGLVLTEARQCDCAIIATNVDGIPEALDGGKAGLLVPPQDIPALANAIIGLLETPAEHARLKSRAKVGLERFGVERMASQITDIYRELIDASLGRKQVLEETGDISHTPMSLTRNDECTSTCTLSGELR
ncbi:glycosyltransferase [Acidobacterium sp. S8]|uniref:glycosyltransferase n=1 Tax=Acidobacterium sp. S8 TaxID=1641854 RepID=UPI001C203429|nr:glycosyltransferase [Acidobacterium sp. S8]